MNRLITTMALASAAASATAEPSLERGTYLVEGPAACGNCHTPIGANGYVEGAELSGRVVEEGPAFTAVAANITPAGRVADWSDAELARAIREGIRPDGTVIGPPMPIALYRGLSDDDLGSIILYLRQVPAVENDPGESVYHIPLPPAYGPPIESVAAVPEGVTPEYGAYLAGPIGHCMECHTTFGEMGPMFDSRLGAGGNEFPGPWGVSVSANITPHPEDGIVEYTDADLDGMIRHGVRPDGTPMLPPMAYPFYAKMTDEDLAAVIAYLRQLPVLPDPDR